MNNFNSGDWVLLKGDKEVEIYSVDYIRNDKYHITQQYSNISIDETGQQIVFRSVLLKTPPKFCNDAEYPVLALNSDARLVSEKLIRLLYDEV